MDGLLDLGGLEREVGRLVALAGATPTGGGVSGEVLLGLGRVVEQLSVLRAVWSREFESGGKWAGDGARSGAAWVAARSIEHPASARGRVHAGRDLGALPVMAGAALRGEVRLGHVRLLVTAARAKPHRWSALPDVEELATRSASELSEPRFARFVDRWAALVDAEHDAQLRAQGVEVPVVDHGAAEQAQRREVYLSRFGSEGMWALAGTLDTETGLALSLALESVSTAIRCEGEERDLPQLRHDALAALLGGELSAGLPVHKGVRPHVMVVVRDTSNNTCSAPLDLAAPADAELLDRTCGDSGALWLTGLARQRLTCDAVIATLTVDHAGVPLRLGRSARVVTPALRRVIDLRDRHCVFAGCTAPAMWCQAHHLIHWEHGGPTDERNLALLCHHHHRVVHEHGFDLRWTPDGHRIHTLRPDRTLIELPEDRTTSHRTPLRL